MSIDLDMQEIYDLFVEESTEGLDVMESGLLELNDGVADPETMNAIFRAAHSIKGGGATFGFTEISEFAHVCETLLDEIRQGQRPVSQDVVDLLLKSVDCMREMLSALKAQGEIDSTAADVLRTELESMMADTPSEPRRDGDAAEVMDVSKDEKVPATSSPKPKKPAAAATESSSIRVNIDKVDALINLVGELVITQSMLSRFDGVFDPGDLDGLGEGLAQLSRNTRDLQESVMQIRMLPISVAFSRFPRLVRDMSKQLGKQVELRLSGEATEVDKTVLEKIGDPLVHLVRNSLDHGLEEPQVRAALGKPETGVLELNAYHKGGAIVIEVTDDGAGINQEKVLAKARERGLVGPDDELTDDRIANLIFMPGFSTVEEVSDLSGRGVGMDVVRRNIKDLGGSVNLSSKPGEGSKLTIRLPLTLAILDGQLLRVADQTYIVPLISIVETIQVTPEKVNAVAGQSELFRLRDEYIPIIRLYEQFGIRPDSTNLEKGLLVIVESDGQRAGVFVDDLLEQQQIVIKSLESNYQQVQGISGATILGDGTVALIVDVNGLLQLFFENADRTAEPSAA